VRRHGTHLLLAALIVTMGAAAATADELTESPDGPEHVKTYYTLDQALNEVFEGADRIWSERWIPSDDQQAAMETRLGRRLPAEEVVFHRAERDSRDLGVALELAEKGRFRPITFLVHVGPDQKVAKVLLMVYRESRGDGVKRQRFLKQFRGKSADNRLRLNRDVVAVSGATMSSRGLTAGVKRALILADTRYGVADRP